MNKELNDIWLELENQLIWGKTEEEKDTNLQLLSDFKDSVK